MSKGSTVAPMIAREGPHSLAELVALARESNLSEERVAPIERRLARRGTIGPAPRIALLGLPRSGIEWVLERGGGVGATRALQSSPGGMLALGGPSWADWPAFRGTVALPRPFLAVLWDESGPDRLREAGDLDLAVVVTRLGQPLNEAERRLARSAARTSALARVLVVGLPGEEATEAELAELRGYAAEQLRAAGFDAGTGLGTVVWYVADAGLCDGDRPASFETLLEVDPVDSAAGRERLLRLACSELVREGLRAARAGAIVPVPPHDVDQILDELDAHLDALERIANEALTGAGAPESALRQAAREGIADWGQDGSAGSIWLRHVERLRPGTRDAVRAECDAALGLLTVRPPAATAPASTTPNSVGMSAPATAPPLSAGVSIRSSALLQRMAAGLVLGSLGYAAVGVLPPPLNQFNVLTFGLVAMAGYAVAGRVFRANGPPPPAPSAGPGRSEALRAEGWADFRQRIVATVATRLAAGGTSQADQWRDWASSLGVPEETVGDELRSG